ncbi:MAG: methionyl aminopeptidase [Waddliaceae bacterium]
MIGRNDPCWCGSEKKWKKCHFPKKNPALPIIDSELRDKYKKKYQIYLKTAEEIQGIRLASALAATILDATCDLVAPGISTQELNDFAHDLHMKAGAKPAPLGYGSPPFPKSILTSINDVICHGIPSKNEKLKEGDIINIDVSSILNGFYGDCSRMVAVGEISQEKQLVFDTSYECLMKSIKEIHPGDPVSKIGDIISDHAESKGCSVVDMFVAHGVGVQFHEGPQILHSRNYNPIKLLPGMTFTIEPMINAGDKDGVIDKKDQWTVRTIDGKPSAQWEHTLLMTEEGLEILTPWVC